MDSDLPRTDRAAARSESAARAAAMLGRPSHEDGPTSRRASRAPVLHGIRSAVGFLAAGAAAREAVLRIDPLWAFVALTLAVGATQLGIRALRLAAGRTLREE